LACLHGRTHHEREIGMSTSDTAPVGGQVITFYSYKGGIGRTMAVANTAWIMASNGLRVLILDWDLESPGLHRYFHPFLADPRLRSTPGVIDLIRDYAGATMERRLDDDPDWFKDYAQVLRYAIPIDWTFPSGGIIDLVPAGRQDATYAVAVSTFDWARFYDRQGGSIFLEALRDSMRASYDYALIDSRTGLSDIAGICTMRLPDVVADCFTMSAQSIDGAVAVAHSITNQRRRQPIRILPVPMRIEDAEKGKLEAGRDHARHRFAEFLKRLTPDEVDRYWGEVEIPYKPFYAYEEILASFGDRSREENSLLAAFERLTGVITEGRARELRPLDDRERRRWLKAFERSLPVAPPEVLISYAPVDRMWAEWICTELADAALRPRLQDVSALDAAGDGGNLEALEAALATADYAVALLSHSYVRSLHAAALWQRLSPMHRGAGQRFLIPLRLDSGPLPEPFGDWPAVDLTGLQAEQARDAILAALDRPSPPHPAATVPTDETRPRPRFPGTLPAVWNIPPRNASFTGREALLDDLRNRLSASITVVVPQGLFGLGGVGKTQIAIEYTHRFAASYDVAWWVPAEQPSMVRSSLAELAARIGVPTGGDITETVREVLEALRQGTPSRRWLLVFDNAEDPDEVREFLPQGPGHVLVTSRNQSWVQELNVVSVGVFSRGESIALLNARAPGLPEADADLVAEKLGDLPLAIEQAGAWLARTGSSVARYLEQLESRLPEMLQQNLPRDYDKPVVAVWLLAFEELRRQTPAAARLLELCAFLGSEPIPQALFNHLQGLDLPASERDWFRDPMLVSQLIQEIGRYALATTDPGQETIQVHRLVQAVLQSQMSAERQAEDRRNVQTLLAAANPRDPDRSAHWPACAALWPHVRPSQIIESGDADARQLVLDLVRYAYLQADFVDSLELAEEALPRWHEAFGPDDQTTLRLRCWMANALRSQGHYDAAYEQDKGAHERLELGAGPNHPYTLAAATSLGADLRALGRYAEAHAKDTDTLERHTSTLGPGHRRTLMAANNLAVSKGFLGDYQGAMQLHRDTLNRRRSNFGERDFHTLSSSYNIGRKHRQLGDLRRSRLLLETTLVAYRETLGDLNTGTMRCAKSLAVTLRKLGDLRTAHELTLSTMHHYQHLLGPDHPDTWASALNLASDQSALGDDQAALATAEAAVAGYRRILGEDHPMTWVSVNNLTIFMRRLGNHTAARAQSEQVVARLRKQLGKRHPFLLDASLNLGNDLSAMGEHGEARRLDEQTYAGFRERFGDDHPDTLAAGSNLAVSLKAAGAPEEARALLESVLRRLRRVLGEDHPSVTAAMAGQRLSVDIELPPI